MTEPWGNVKREPQPQTPEELVAAAKAMFPNTILSDEELLGFARGLIKAKRAA